MTKAPISVPPYPEFQIVLHRSIGKIISGRGACTTDKAAMAWLRMSRIIMAVRVRLFGRNGPR